MSEAIKKLTEIQEKVGYKKGDINTVALMGLCGEVGEVLDETFFTESAEANAIMRDFSAVAQAMDALKKLVRDKKMDPPIVNLTPEREENFDSEMGDVLYYLNALAICRGKTLDYYAELSYQKVLKKSATDISHGTINKETLQ